MQVIGERSIDKATKERNKEQHSKPRWKRWRLWVSSDLAIIKIAENHSARGSVDFQR